MAGIGFEIRKILKKRTLLSIIQGFSYAGMISAGPWLVSMVSIFIAGLIAYNKFGEKVAVEFMVMITYIMALSLVVTSFLQLSFSRYVADRVFEKRVEKIFPNTFGAVLLAMILGSGVAYLFVDKLEFGLIYFFAFILFCAIWIVNIVLSGMKNYKAIVFSFFVSYLLIVVFSYFAKNFMQLMMSFVIGEIVLFLSLSFLIAKRYYLGKIVEFDFLKNSYIELVFTGFFLIMGSWIDKFIFWYLKGVEVIGNFRYSPVYDYPMFLAYLIIAPGMAIFLLRVETDFVEYYEKYFELVRTTGTLSELEYYGNMMKKKAKYALLEILRIQVIFLIVIALFSKAIFEFFNLPQIYLRLFFIDMVGTTLQLFFFSILTILFYLDKRKEVLFLSFLQFLLNLILTLFTLKLGIKFYGYGFGVSFLIASIVALEILNRAFERLDYETFMLS